MRGGTNRTSRGPFTPRVDLAEGKNPPTISYLQESQSVRRRSERWGSAAGRRFRLLLAFPSVFLQLIYPPGLELFIRQRELGLHGSRE